MPREAAVFSQEIPNNTWVQLLDKSGWVYQSTGTNQRVQFVDQSLWFSSAMIFTTVDPPHGQPVMLRPLPQPYGGQ